VGLAPHGDRVLDAVGLLEDALLQRRLVSNFHILQLHNTPDQLRLLQARIPKEMGLTMLPSCDASAQCVNVNSHKDGLVEHLTQLVLLHAFHLTLLTL